MDGGQSYYVTEVSIKRLSGERVAELIQKCLELSKFHKDSGTFPGNIDKELLIEQLQLLQEMLKGD